MRVFHFSAIQRTLRRQKARISIAFLIFSGLALPPSIVPSIVTSSARAGLITSGSYTAIGSAGNASASVITDYPTFDITSAAKTFTSVGPLDFQFPVTPNAATVTYFVSEGITNNTNQTWTDYHEQLGTGTDGNFSVGGTPVDFLIPTDSTYTNPSFSARSVTASEIDYTGGAIAPGQAISLTFSITVPDINAAGPGDFTLRQFPTVPEPGTLALLALGSIRLLARRRRAS